MLFNSGKIGQAVLEEKLLQLERKNEAISLDNINLFYPSEVSS